MLDKPLKRAEPQLIDDITQARVTPPSDHQEHKRTVSLRLSTHIVKIIFSIKHPQKYGRIFAVICLLPVLALIIYRSLSPTTDPIPAYIRKSVTFNVYYPVQNDLPSGYVFNVQAISSSNQTVLYTVGYGHNQKLIFTEQDRPSDIAIKGFYSVHMPLYIPVDTSVGTAALGELNHETVISLPTNTNTWILMTAPLNADQSQLKKVVRSLAIAD